MEVNAISFKGRLLGILDDLSKCEFVAFDLELSGIPTHRSKMPTLQERYEDLKAAAERYQILQVGLTFVFHDFEREVYVLKPYNFNLSPMLAERLDIERDFTFSSGALEFLFRNGYDLKENFSRGMSYLTPDEAIAAKQNAYNRLERNLEDIQLDPGDQEALDLLEDLRKEITFWKDGKSEELYIVAQDHVITDGRKKRIATRKPSDDEPSVELSRFERRLIHQLVRAEFPELVTIGGRDNNVKIIYRDACREKEFLRKKKHAVKEQIKRQTGFRWIVDAMIGKPLHRLDLLDFAWDENRSRKAVNLPQLGAQWTYIRENLKTQHPVLIGHNCFLDFVYFYRKFIGTLPDTVEEFRSKIHELFPLVIDTKYMATHNCGDINPTSTLFEIDTKLLVQKKPRTGEQYLLEPAVKPLMSLLELHPAHTKYGSSEPLHEAGFDSYLTARVAIKIAAKLEEQGNYRRPESVLSDSFFQTTEPDEFAGREETTKSLATIMRENVWGRTSSKENSALRDAVTETCRSSSPTIFGELASLEIGDGKDEEQQAAPIEWPQSPSVGASEWSAHGDLTTMPPWTSDFWRIYGNKFRVFGTLEAALDLNPESSPISLARSNGVSTMESPSADDVAPGRWTAPRVLSVAKEALGVLSHIS